jgi:phosphatidylinositol 4-phosphatase
MKRLFSKSSKNRQPSTPAVPAQNNVAVRTPALQPKSAAPASASSYLRPHDHIAVLPTQDGLLLRPHVARQAESDGYVRIAWGKVPEIKQFQGPIPTAGVNRTLAVIVYGIIGILDLFAGSLPTLPSEVFLDYVKFLRRILSPRDHVQAGGRT